MHTKRILIIDDEEDFSVLMKNYFEKKNHQVELAYSLRAGLARIKEFAPDHIFLDNQLPDGIGWAETQFILKNYPQIQLTLISVYMVPKTSAQHFRILEKPVTLAEIEAIINESPLLYFKENEEESY